ncbi:MAG: type IV pilus assembly protein PilM [Candidatus Hydrogenedentes bacterium]|nr:type IV pilus assembly protein PilM [Candidatus Hydrogenedentota bacterium]
MAKRKRSRVNRLVLDIGTSAVRLCELSPTKTGYQLTKYYQREFQIEPSMEEEEQHEIRLNTLKDLLKEARVRAKKVVVGVPGQSVFMRPRALPPVQEHKVNQIVRYEILQQIPFSLEQIAFDYQILNRTDAGGYEVLMAAIKVDVVEKCLQLVRDVKRGIGVVDVCPLAAYNWLKQAGEFGEQGECVALIDLGASTTDIIIERENQFRFPRSVNFGGNDITAAISHEFKIPFLEAERLKRERGFAPTGDPKRDGKGGEVIGRVLGRLMSEINRSFAYFRSQPGGGTVSRIVVTGGGACLRNIIPYMQRQLGAEVRIAQPLAGLAIAPGAQEVNEHPEQASVALGLGLRCLQPVPIQINLVPPRVVEAGRRKEQAFYIGMVAVALGLIFTTIIPVSAQKNQQVRAQSDKIEAVIRQYDPRMVRDGIPPAKWRSQYEQELADEKGKINYYRERVQRLDWMYNRRIQWQEYIDVINEARPKGKLVVIHTFETISITGDAAAAQPEAAAVASASTGGVTGGGLREAAERARAEAGQRPNGGAAPAADDDDPLASAAPDAAAKPASPLTRATPPTRAGDKAGGETSRTETFHLDAPSGKSDEAELAMNAIRIQGYARDAETLTEFVDALKNSGAFIQDGVYFSARDSDKVPANVLYTTGSPTTTRTSGAAAGWGQGQGAFSGLQPGAYQAYQPNYSAAPVAGMGAELRSFKIELQVAGAARLAEPEPTGGARAGGGAQRSAADKLRERMGR